MKDRAPDGALEKTLEDGLAARNFLVRRVLADNIEMLPKPVDTANKALQPLVTGSSLLLDGVSHEAMLAEMKALFS